MRSTTMSASAHATTTAPAIIDEDMSRRSGHHATQLRADRELALVDALDAIAQRALDVADVLDQPHEAADLDGSRLIGTPHRAIEREVALDEACAERDRGPRRR